MQLLQDSYISIRQKTQKKSSHSFTSSNQERPRTDSTSIRLSSIALLADIEVGVRDDREGSDDDFARAFRPLPRADVPKLGSALPRPEFSVNPFNSF